jgi:hypothetical protein
LCEHVAPFSPLKKEFECPLGHAYQLVKFF